MRLPLDDAGRDDPAGQPDVRGARRPHARRADRRDAASRTCSPPAAASTTRRTTRRCCGCRGPVREIALEIVRADGSRLPALVNSVLRYDDDGRPRRRAHDGVRRDRPPSLRGGAAACARAASTRSRCSWSAACSPGSCPRTGASRSASTYRPAVRGDEVGGDWYDAFWLDDADGLGVVVGRRRRARDRRRSDDGPAAQRGPRARLDGLGPAAAWTRSTRTRAATRSGTSRPWCTCRPTSPGARCATPARGTRRRCSSSRAGRRGFLWDGRSPPARRGPRRAAARRGGV